VRQWKRPPRGLASIRQFRSRQRRIVLSRSPYPDDAPFPCTTEHA
jgi:hypothetical protein